MKSTHNNCENTVFIRGIAGLPETKKEHVLKSVLGQYGEIRSLNIDRHNGRFAFAEFVKTESVTEILQTKKAKIQGCTIYFHKFQNPKSKAGTERRTEEKKQGPDGKTVTKTHSELMELLSKATDMEDQLRELIEGIRLTEEDGRIRKEICAALQKLLYPYFTKCKIYQFGSSMNNFGAKHCDLDLFVDFHSDEESSVQNKPQVRLPFHKDLTSVKVSDGPLTAEQFESFNSYDGVKLISRMINRKNSRFVSACPIPSKRCPLVKFTDFESDLSCDLSLNNRKALYNSGLLRLYGTSPVVKHVVMAVRYWAKVQEIAGNWQFTVSSYALTWMVLFFLMYRQPQVIPKVWDVLRCVEGVRLITVDSWKTVDVPLNSQLPLLVHVDSPVHLLREFFQFYASEVDWDSTVILTSSATFISRDSFKDQFPQCQTGLMNMLDPFDLSHNILQRVNETAKVRFVEQMKRAAELSQNWAGHSVDPHTDTWGIATLFVPNQDPILSPSKAGKSKKRKKKGSSTLDDSDSSQDFTINFPLAKTAHLGCHSMWCDLVRKMLVNILQDVFMADVKLESNSLGSDTENNLKVEEAKRGDESFAEENKVTASDVNMEDPVSRLGVDAEDPVSKQEVNVEDTAGPPVPWVISLDESQASEESPPAGSSKTTHNTGGKFLKPQQAQRKSGSLGPSAPASVCQFTSNDKFKSRQSGASVSKRSSCNGTGKCVVKGNGGRDKAVIDRGNGSRQPTASRVKRSSEDACLDKSSSDLETNSDSQKLRNAQGPASLGQNSQRISSKPASKRVRLLSTNGDEKEDGAERNKSFICDTNRSEQVSEMKSFDPAVISKFEKSLVMEVSPEDLPSLLKSSAQNREYVSRSTYSCHCSNPVWQGRNKTRALVAKSNNLLQGLALEREVSRRLMETFNQTQSQKGDGASQSPKAKVVPSEAEMRVKKALLTSLKEADVADQKASHSQGHISEPSGGSSSNRAFESTSSVPSSDCEAIQFSCEIIEKFTLQTGTPFVQLKFYPLSSQMNGFKNFFSCAMSMMTRLVSSDLLNND